MLEERIIGGLRCSDVLARLSDYVDSELPRAEVERIDEHLRGCDLCERFGGEFTEAIKALKERLARDVPAGLHERMKRRIPG